MKTDDALRILVDFVEFLKKDDKEKTSLNDEKD